MNWQEIAVATIHSAADGYIGDDLDELEREIRAAYPFGERKRWPYKVWLKCVNEYMDFARRRFFNGGEAVMANTSGLPLFRMAEDE